jgi:hypothetical protein
LWYLSPSTLSDFDNLAMACRSTARPMDSPRLSCKVCQFKQVLLGEVQWGSLACYCVWSKGSSRSTRRVHWSSLPHPI